MECGPEIYHKQKIRLVIATRYLLGMRPFLPIEPLQARTAAHLFCPDLLWRFRDIPEPRNTVVMGLKNIALQLCTCTWLEIMTGAGIVLYMLYLGSYTLAALTAAVFSPLIIFHFAMTKISKSNVDWKPRNRIARIR